MLIRYGFVLLLLLFVPSIDSRRSGGRGRSASRTSSSHTSARRGSAKFVKRISKPGSIERTSLFRSTILGAAAGYVTFQSGRHLIHSPTSPISFEGRQYYWDSQLAPTVEEFPVQCSNPIDPNDPQLGKLTFPDDTRPREIVYNCRESESCCGFECCSETSFFKSIFSLLVMILIMSILGIFCIEGFRWGIQCMYNCRTGNKGQFEPLSI